MIAEAAERAPVDNAQDVSGASELSLGGRVNINGRQGNGTRRMAGAGDESTTGGRDRLELAALPARLAALPSYSRPHSGRDLSC